MIKVKKPPCPKKLDAATRKALTQEYLESSKSVWKKDFITIPLAECSHHKCSYCECRLKEEGKDMQVDHFFPKSLYPEKVLDWKNLLPACARCNRNKSNHDPQKEPIVDPTKMTPNAHLIMINFRFYDKGNDPAGKNTIEVLNLNDRKGLMMPRFKACEITDLQIEKMLLLMENFQQNRVGDSKHQRLLKNTMADLLLNASPTEEYSATIATAIVNNPDFEKLLQFMKKKKLWSREHSNLYQTIRKNAFAGR